MNDDVSRRLDEAGRRPVPPPDPAFADALEARLGAVAATPPAASTPPPRGRRSAAGPWAVAAGFAAVVVVVIALGLAGPDRPPGPGLTLEGVNVEVVLANGTILEDPAGLLLPEGAVVRVGAGGFARIGDTLLAPGDVATIGRGGIEVVRPTPVGVVPEATPRPTAARPSASPAPTPSPAAERTEPPAPTPEPSRSPGPTAPATARPTPTPTPAILRPRLRAVLLEGPRIAVRWTETQGAARYVLVATVSRSGPAPDPVYPGSRVIGEFAAPPSPAFRVRVPDGVVEVRLMVVAVREDGRALRRSRVVAIAIAGPLDPAASIPGSSPTPTLAPTSPAALPTPAP